MQVVMKTFLEPRTTNFQSTVYVSHLLFRDFFSTWVHYLILVDWKKHSICLFHGCSRRPFFGRRSPLCPKLFLLSGHSSIVESSSSHAMILLQQQQMKFKQRGHVSRSGPILSVKNLGWFTLPETNSSPLKMMVSNRNLPFSRWLFSGAKC